MAHAIKVEADNDGVSEDDSVADPDFDIRQELDQVGVEEEEDVDDPGMCVLCSAKGQVQFSLGGNQCFGSGIFF